MAVTGVLGFVGTRLVPRLRDAGWRIIAIVRPGRDARALEREGVEVREADLAAAAVPAAAFAGADALVHLSGMSQATGFIAALHAAGVSHGVYVSSAGVHTRLPSPGAESKRVAERSLVASGLDHVVLRPSMIYGTPADRNMARLLRWLRRCPVVPVPGGGGVLQQPIHVDDLVAAILAALDQPPGTRAVYDVGGPEAMPLAEVIRVCARAVGRRAWIVPVPLGPAHGVVRLARALGLPSVVRPEQVLRLAESKAVDIGPMRAGLGVHPRPFEAGIRAEAGLLGRLS